MKKHLYLLTPFLFALFPIVSLYSQNTDELYLKDLVWPILMVETFALTVLTVLGLIMRNLSKAVVLASLFLILFFVHGYAFAALKNIGFTQEWVFFGGWMGAYLAFTVWLYRTRRDMSPMIRFASTMAWFIVLFSTVPLLFHEVGRAGEVRKVTRLETLKPLNLETAEAPQEPLPDIYYLIFDRYPNNAVLKEFYDYDNTPFTKALEERGFYVATDSQANYFCTSQSLLSSLNLQHINDMKQRLGDTPCDWHKVFDMLEDYAVWRFLKQFDYRFVHVGNWWQPTRTNRHADENIVLFPSEFTFVLYDTTPLPLISTKIKLFDYEYFRWEQDQKMFQRLAQTAGAYEQPAFVFSHMLLPHPPYFFTAEGGFLPRHVAEAQPRIDNFRGQLIYTNDQILPLVDALLKNSKTPPIIILQSDEGPYPGRYENNRGNGDPIMAWENAELSEIREKSGILNAYYFPDGDYSRLYPSITPVNSFRHIFNTYFHTRLDPLPDNIYAYPDVDRPCDFVDMTQRILSPQTTP